MLNKNADVFYPFVNRPGVPYFSHLQSDFSLIYQSEIIIKKYMLEYHSQSLFTCNKHEIK